MLHTALDMSLHPPGYVTYSMADFATYTRQCHTRTPSHTSLHTLGCVTHSITHVTRYLGCVTYSITLCATYARPCHILIASHTSRHPLGYVIHGTTHFATSDRLCHTQHCTCHYIHWAVSHTALHSVLHPLGCAAYS